MDILSGSGKGASAADMAVTDADDASLIKDTTTATFMADVIEASKSVPVIVDFWAPWCGPCKQLTPVLEKVVRNARGKVRLVKMNIDEHPEVAGQLRVQSIPAVFGFKQGQPVDAFQGALPESQIVAFVERLAGAGAVEEDGVEVLLSSGEESLEAGDVTGAAEIFAAILAENPDEARAYAGLARCHLQTGAVDQAEAVLGSAPDAVQTHDALARVRSMINVARDGEGAGEVAELRAKAQANPQDWQAHMDLATALNANNDREGATDALVHIIAHNRAWNDEAARKQLVEYFEAWGPTDPATVEGRQKLSSVLFS